MFKAKLEGVANYGIQSFYVYLEKICLQKRETQSLSKVSSYTPKVGQEKCSTKEVYALRLISCRVSNTKNYLLLLLVFFIV